MRVQTRTDFISSISLQQYWAISRILRELSARKTDDYGSNFDAVKANPEKPTFDISKISSKAPTYNPSGF